MCPLRDRSSRSLAGSTTEASRQAPPHQVKHDYHDFSVEPCDEFELSFDPAVMALEKSSFPMKLYFMLEDMQAKGLDWIVSWQAHGRSFVVHNPVEFQQIFPRYFKLSKMASFLRQLNLYGFTRLTRGADRGAYYHECFLRGRPALLSRLRRTKVKGTGIRARSDPEHEPNFWRMKGVGPGPTPEKFPEPTAPVATGLASGSSTIVGKMSANTPQDSVVPRLPMKNQTLVVDSLSLWVAPIAAASAPATVDPDNTWDGFTMGDITDETYLNETIYDILKDGDLLFTDMLDMIA